MAGDWIKIEKATARKREVLVIAGELGIHPDHAFGLCFRFWAWCDENLRECHAQNVTFVTVDSLIGHAGFAAAMAKAGWLIDRNEYVEIPNFDRHLSQSAKTRALAAERKQRERGKVTPKSRQCHESNVTKAGPEKRREEIESESINAPEVGRVRPTLEQAKAAAPMAGVTPEEAEEWWHKREATDWMRSLGGGAVAPVGENFRADMRQFVESNRERKANEKNRKHNPNGRRVDRNAGNLNAGGADEYAGL